MFARGLAHHGITLNYHSKRYDSFLIASSVGRSDDVCVGLYFRWIILVMFLSDLKLNIQRENSWICSWNCIDNLSRVWCPGSIFYRSSIWDNIALMRQSDYWSMIYKSLGISGMRFINDSLGNSALHRHAIAILVEDLHEHGCIFCLEVPEASDDELVYRVRW